MFEHWKAYPERQLEKWMESELISARSGYGQQLWRILVREAVDDTKSDPKVLMEAVRTFISSPDFGVVPFVKISSWLYATAARQAKAQANPPSRGFLADVEFISCFLPHCDAVFLDRQCRAYLDELRIAKRVEFDARAFSMANREGLIDFINELERSAPPEQLRLADRLHTEGAYPS